MNIEDIERLLKSGKRMGTTKEGCYIAGALDARDELIMVVREHLYDNYGRLVYEYPELVNGLVERMLE